MEAPLRNDYLDPEFYSELPEGIKLTFYGANKGDEAVLTANYAIIRKKGMFLSGKVKMTTKDRGTLSTESLTWDQESQIISTNDMVEVRNGRKLIYGQGLQATQDFSRVDVQVVVMTLPITDR